MYARPYFCYRHAYLYDKVIFLKCTQKIKKYIRRLIITRITLELHKNYIINYIEY